jgi:hypothetical protein
LLAFGLLVALRLPKGNKHAEPSPLRSDP